MREKRREEKRREEKRREEKRREEKREDGVPFKKMLFEIEKKKEEKIH